ncbi:hypothetical protein KW796_02760 [Candidatus Parcubacteria bacterium]|nr:hypothetical protein [Candidatus Parcubacteria bacterium]
MTKQELKSLNQWLKKFPWIWAICQEWNEVRISAQRADTTTKLLQAITIGETWFFADEGGYGPQIGMVKKEVESSRDRVELILRYLEQQRGRTLQFIACYNDREIIIYKPPTDGWERLLTMTLNQVRDRNTLKSATSS